MFQRTFGEISSEEDDNYDSDLDPPFIPSAIPEADEDYDEYSEEEIPADEIKELEQEGEAELDVEDLRKKMLEVELGVGEAETVGKLRSIVQISLLAAGRQLFSTRPTDSTEFQSIALSLSLSLTWVGLT